MNSFNNLPQKIVRLILKIIKWIFKFSALLILLFFMVFGYFSIVDKTPTRGNEATNFCEIECENSSNFNTCMNSCFLTLGGTEGLKFIFIPLGVLSLIIFIGWLIIEVDNFNKFRKRIPNKTQQ